MKIIVKKPGEQPHLRDILGNLEECQEIVGGYIEVAANIGSILLICNEEGKLKGLEYNFSLPEDIIVCTVFFVGQDREDFRSLTDEEAKIIFDWFKV